MRIADLVREDVPLILPQLKATNKVDVIQELAAFLAHHHEDVSEADAVHVLSERESRGSTAVGVGLAMPHGKLTSVRGLVGCLGRSQRGIDFGAPDGKPTHFFFVLIAPESAPGEHLKALARISRLFKNAAFRTRLAAAQTAHEMHEIIAAEDAE